VGATDVKVSGEKDVKRRGKESYSRRKGFEWGVGLILWWKPRKMVSTKKKASKPDSIGVSKRRKNARIASKNPILNLTCDKTGKKKSKPMKKEVRKAARKLKRTSKPERDPYHSALDPLRSAELTTLPNHRKEKRTDVERHLRESPIFIGRRAENGYAWA